MKISELKDKKIAILWYGREGKSNLTFLLSSGVSDITILDKSESLEDLPETVEAITGESYLDALDSYDYIFKSPGVSPFHKKLLPYRNRLISGTQIFFENYRGKVIGITGTKGKSTLSSLLFECLEAAWYDVKLVGNIGLPVLDQIDVLSGEVYDYVIYEMSSYMLQDFIPQLEIAILNNIYPCHLDWHGDLNTYKNAKLNILKQAKHCFVNTELRSKIEWKLDTDVVFFNDGAKYSHVETGFFIGNELIYPEGRTALKWEHNMRNITAIIAVLDQIIQDKQLLQKTLLNVLPNFSGLEDRIENIGTHEGITFINDAIATTPESTIAAINTFEDTLQTLFLWGEDSGFSFDTLRKRILDSNIENIIAFPDTSEKVFPEIELRDYEKAFEVEIEGKIINCIKTRSMQEGVDFAYKTTYPWKIALLSCWAPSFSLWKSYKDKAAEFKREVSNY